MKAVGAFQRFLELIALQRQCFFSLQTHRSEHRYLHLQFVFTVVTAHISVAVKRGSVKELLQLCVGILFHSKPLFIFIIPFD